MFHQRVEIFSSHLLTFLVSTVCLLEHKSNVMFLVVVTEMKTNETNF